MTLIKLTAIDGTAFWLNPTSIMDVRKKDEHTKIWCLNDWDFTVRETPEQIAAIIVAAEERTHDPSRD